MNLVGVDGSEKMIEIARDRYPATEFFVMDITMPLPFENNQIFSADKYTESDGSVTLSLNEIDIIENGKNEQEARLNALIVKSIFRIFLRH